MSILNAILQLYSEDIKGMRASINLTLKSAKYQFNPNDPKFFSKTIVKLLEDYNVITPDYKNLPESTPEEVQIKKNMQRVYNYDFDNAFFTIAHNRLRIVESSLSDAFDFALSELVKVFPTIVDKLDYKIANSNITAFIQERFTFALRHWLEKELRWNHQPHSEKDKELEVGTKKEEKNKDKNAILYTDYHFPLVNTLVDRSIWRPTEEAAYEDMFEKDLWDYLKVAHIPNIERKPRDGNTPDEEKKRFSEYIKLVLANTGQQERMDRLGLTKSTEKWYKDAAKKFLYDFATFFGYENFTKHVDEILKNRKTKPSWFKKERSA